MRIHWLILLWIAIAVTGLTSCVSKRKYLDMESAKLRAETRIRELTDQNELLTRRVESLIVDFEQMKQGLLQSNAQKDELIGSLNGEINRLKLNVRETSATVEEQLYSFDFERRRLQEEALKSQQARTAVESRNGELEQELNKVKEELAALRLDFDTQVGDTQRAVKKAESQAAQAAKLQSEVSRLTVVIKEKDETIKRLTDNINSLKKEPGQ